MAVRGLSVRGNKSVAIYFHWQQSLRPHFYTFPYKMKKTYVNCTQEAAANGYDSRRYLIFLVQDRRSNNMSALQIHVLTTHLTLTVR